MQRLLVGRKLVIEQPVRRLRRAPWEYRRYFTTVPSMTHSLFPTLPLYVHGQEDHQQPTCAIIVVAVGSVAFGIIFLPRPRTSKNNIMLARRVLSQAVVRHSAAVAVASGRGTANSSRLVTLKSLPLFQPPRSSTFSTAAATSSRIGASVLTPTDQFARRHIGPSLEEEETMLRTCGFKDLEEMTDAAVPKHIRLHGPVELEPAKSESEALTELKAIAGKNKVDAYDEFVQRAHASDVLVVAATDLMALTTIRSPGDFGVDVCVGSAQRFGVPMAYGGPHAAFMASKAAYSRKMAGRIIGVSVDSRGKPALRMAMQTREQHIRRDKATSNICTAQALLANMAASYGVYHGPEGLKKIAARIHGLACITATALSSAGFAVDPAPFFDTIKVDVASKGLTAQQVAEAAVEEGLNIRVIDETHVGLAFGETLTKADVEGLLRAFGVRGVDVEAVAEEAVSPLPAEMARKTEFMTHPVYKEMIDSLHKDLAAITGFAAVSSQPNSGAQGEFAGLLCIRHYHESRGDSHRNICLIPVSAHGTNPASAVMCGYKVVVVASDDKDVAKRLQDYGFHSPTMSWPVSGTLMVEPTESEDKGELDRLCDALIAIRGEIDAIAAGKLPVDDSPLRNAPHTIDTILSATWDRPYTREAACYPAPWVKANKFWPSVGRLDNVHGDRNLICSCPPMETYQEDEDENKKQVA
ncbi:glycine dehydrogenase [Nannochloropsis oceanica]